LAEHLNEGIPVQLAQEIAEYAMHQAPTTPWTDAK
jgi:hypothetical protein